MALYVYLSFASLHAFNNVLLCCSYKATIMIDKGLDLALANAFQSKLETAAECVRKDSEQRSTDEFKTCIYPAAVTQFVTCAHVTSNFGWLILPFPFLHSWTIICQVHCKA